MRGEHELDEGDREERNRWIDLVGILVKNKTGGEDKEEERGCASGKSCPRTLCCFHPDVVVVFEEIQKTA